MPLPPAALFWTAFVTALTSHAFVVAAFGAFSAYFIAERWQRWRQQREFQHRAMLEFAEASVSVLSILWDMAQARARGSTARYRELVELYPSKLEPLVARDAQFYAVFEDEKLVGELAELTQLMKRVLVKVTDTTSSPVAVDPKIVRSGIQCMTAQRRLILGHMAREMRLRTRLQVKALERQLGEQAAAVPAEFAPPAGAPGAPVTS